MVRLIKMNRIIHITHPPNTTHSTGYLHVCTKQMKESDNDVRM